MRNLLIFVPALLLMAFSCNKDQKSHLTSSGTLMYTGSMALDGCDWVIVVDSIYYHPVNLPEDFKINDERTVTLKYTLTGGNFTCFYPTVKMPEIRIDDIKFQ